MIKVHPETCPPAHPRTPACIGSKGEQRVCPYVHAAKSATRPPPPRKNTIVCRDTREARRRRRTHEGNHTQPRERTPHAYTKTQKTNMPRNQKSTTPKAQNHANQEVKPGTQANPRMPACIGSKRYAAAHRASSRRGGSHTPPPRAHVCYMQRMKATKGVQPRAMPTPAKGEERYAHTHTGDPCPPQRAAQTGNEGHARTGKPPQAQHDRHRHGRATWYKGTRRVQNARTHINTSASMLHAALRHATKSTTITTSKKVCVVEKTCPPPHTRFHREHKGEANQTTHG